MSQLKLDLDPSLIGSLTELDFGILGTPEGTTYVDVLASDKNKVQTTIGKDAELAKWDAEVRKSVANKKTVAGPNGSGAAALTKQQQAAVNAQLAEEARIRQRVVGIRENLLRGLYFVRSLVASGAEEFRGAISEVAGLLLEGVLGTSAGTSLVGEEAVATYLELANCTAGRLDSIRRWVGIATLRSFNVPAVPEELQAEPLNLLIIRVLYRLRFLSEQATFDVATFSYAYPLLSKVLLQGGISSEAADEAWEQVALALGIIKFNQMS